MVEGIETLAKGTYTVVIMALWNPVALENTDYQNILISVHAPCAIKLIAKNSQVGLRTI